MPRQRNDGNLPSHSWLFFNRARDYLAWLFVGLVLFSFIVIWTITYTIRRDCTDVYNRRLSLGNYWLQVNAGSNKEGCPK